MPKFDFTEGDLRQKVMNNFNLFYFRRDKPYALTGSTDGLVFETGRGDGSLPADEPRRFGVSYKDRCEIGRVGYGDEGKEGTISTYSFRFKCMSPQEGSSYKFWTDRWWVLVQAHHGKKLGFPRGWPWQLNVSSQANSLNFLYGLSDSPERYTFDAKWGEWQEITIKCKWSQGDDGWAQVFHFDELVASPMGPNIAHDLPRGGMECKFGIYRGNWIYTRDSVVFSHASFE